MISIFINFFGAKATQPPSRCPISSRSRPGWLAAWASFLAAGGAAASLSVSPVTVSNAFNGVVSLTITGLNSPGQTVIVERYFDGNNSNTINSGDLLTQQFKVTDGQVTSVAGRRNLNIPGDEDGAANTSVLTKLYFTPSEITGRIDGRYIFRVSPEGPGFAPFTAPLTITQQDHGGSGISGTVMAGATAQPNAIVLLAAGASNDFDVAGLTKTDASGNYSLKLPPGVYRPVSVKKGFVVNLETAPLVTVNPRVVAASPNAMLTVRERTIAGAVREGAAPHTGLPGILVFGQSQTGMFSFTFSDASGNYELDATAGAWEVGTLETPLALHGMVHRQEVVESSPGSVSGFNLEALRATSLIHGTMRTTASAAVPFVDVSAETDGDPGLQATGFTDADGNFTIGVTPSQWSIHAESSGYLVPGESVSVNTDGTAVGHNLTANPVTARLSGRVRDDQNNAVGNIEILAHDFHGTNSRALTDASGTFDISVFGGPGGTSKTWSLQLNQGDSEEPSAYVSSNVEFQVVDGAYINNIDYVVHAITAHLRGRLLDEIDAPVGNAHVFASGGNGTFNSSSQVAGDGSFDIPVFGGAWQIGLSNDFGSGLLPQNNLLVTVTDNVDQNGIVFRARHTNGTVSGTVKNSNGEGLAGVIVSAVVALGGVDFTSSSAADASGHYSLPVFSATWKVNADGFDLQMLGYLPTPSQSIATTAGNTTVNFTASAAGQTFATWQTTKFTPGESADPSLGGTNGDFDRDGMTNLMEYALHLEPKIPDTTGLPVPGTLPNGPGERPWVTLTFRRLTGSSGLTYQVQESPALDQAWSIVAGPYEILSSDGVTEIVRAKAPGNPGGRSFLRLRIDQSGR